MPITPTAEAKISFNKLDRKNCNAVITDMNKVYEVNTLEHYEVAGGAEDAAACNLAATSGSRLWSRELTWSGKS